MCTHVMVAGGIAPLPLVLGLVGTYFRTYRKATIIGAGFNSWCTQFVFSCSAH